MWNQIWRENINKKENSRNKAIICYTVSLLIVSTKLYYGWLLKNKVFYVNKGDMICLIEWPVAIYLLTQKLIQFHLKMHI